MLRTLVHIVFCLLWGTQLFSQEVIATSGDFSAIPEGSLSWTLGEIVTETASVPGYTLTQGFQQDYERFASLEELSPQTTLIIYPNPVNNQLNLTVSNAQPHYELTVLDYQSKIILHKELYFPAGTKSISLDLSDLSSGYYLLELTTVGSNERIVQSIVKTN